MIVSRNVINSKIIYKDYLADRQIRSYGFLELSNLIDAFKNLLLNNFNCCAGEKILIGNRPGIIQSALIFAAAELGLIIVVVDYEIKNWYDTEYIDPKTKLMMPIDYFFCDLNTVDNPKPNWFKNICKNVIFVEDGIIIKIQIYNNSIQHYNLDYKTNDIINALPESTLMICTSSGTTGTPKIVIHNHEFIYKLLQRNKIFYYGKVGVIRNLQHGSSFATYFLPAIASEKTDFFYNFKNGNLLKQYNTADLDHLMLPYYLLMAEFLNSLKKHPKLNLYTLGYIKSSWKHAANIKKLKDIISFFGSNETSGPVLINKISDPDFIENKYVKIDDFYNISFNDRGSLEVILPIYNKSIQTNDAFKLEEDHYFHIGRNDLIRINDKDIDIKNYNFKIKELLNADPIYDTVYQKIYLAIWENTKELNKLIEKVNSFLQKFSNNSHKIDKFAILEQEQFLTGIKLDQELLRDYFRNYYDKQK